VSLDGGEFRHPNVGPQGSWIIWLNANGVCFEEILQFLAEYGATVGCHVLAFNYRGVGLSTGKPLSGLDLVKDGEAAVRFLRKRGVAPEKILLHGHSGGSGTEACGSENEAVSNLPSGPIINDRSFASLPAVISALARGVMGAIVGGLALPLATTVIGVVGIAGGLELSSLPTTLRVLCAVGLGGQFGFALQQNPVVSFGGFMAGLCPSLLCCYLEKGRFSIAALMAERAIGAEVVGAILGFSGLAAPLYAQLAALLGWELNAARAWRKIRVPKAIIYHRNDAIIEYRAASLFSAAESQRGVGETQAVELTAHRGQGISPVCHMYPLNSNPAEWQEVVGIACSLLGLRERSAMQGPAAWNATETAQTPHVMRQNSNIQRRGGIQIPLVSE